MSNELRAAAERAFATAEDRCMQLPSNSCQFENDVCDVAEAYLAEHPADDAEPVTEEWLESVGASIDDSKWSGTPLGGDMFRYGDSMLIVNRTVGFAHLMNAPFKTRADVRRLCAALGVELTERKESSE